MDNISRTAGELLKKKKCISLDTSDLAPQTLCQIIYNADFEEGILYITCANRVKYVTSILSKSYNNKAVLAFCDEPMKRNYKFSQRQYDIVVTTPRIFSTLLTGESAASAYSTKCAYILEDMISYSAKVLACLHLVDWPLCVITSANMQSAGGGKMAQMKRILRNCTAFQEHGQNKYTGEVHQHQCHCANTLTERKLKEYFCSEIRKHGQITSIKRKIIAEFINMISNLQLHYGMFIPKMKLFTLRIELYATSDIPIKTPTELEATEDDYLNITGIDYPINDHKLSYSSKTQLIIENIKSLESGRIVVFVANIDQVRFLDLLFRMELDWQVISIDSANISKKTSQTNQFAKCERCILISTPNLISGLLNGIESHIMITYGALKGSKAHHNIQKAINDAIKTKDVHVYRYYTDIDLVLTDCYTEEYATNVIAGEHANVN